MTNKLKIGSLFYQIKDTVNTSSDRIVLESTDKIDSDILQQFLGRQLSDNDSQFLNGVIKSLPRNKFLELSLG